MSFYNPAYYLATQGIFVSPGAEIFYVNNSTSTLAPGAIGGSDGNEGVSPQAPFATLEKAVESATAGRGDVVIIMPGHAETLTAVQLLDKAGLQVVGVKIGNKRPVFTINGAVDLFSVTAANVGLFSVECNIVTTDAATAFVNVAAAGCRLKDLWMVPSAASVNVVDVITLASGGNDCVIEDCHIRNTTVAVNSFVSIEAAVSNLTMKGNRFMGDTVTAGIIDGAAATFLLMEDNTIMTIGTTQPAATLDSNPTGVVDNNRFLGTHTTIASNNSLGNAVRQARSFVLEDTANAAQATNIIPVLDVE